MPVPVTVHVFSEFSVRKAAQILGNSKLPTILPSDTVWVNTEKCVKNAMDLN